MSFSCTTAHHTPQNRRNSLPFTVEIEVDTANLVYGQVYDGELEFVLEVD